MGRLDDLDTNCLLERARTRFSQMSGPWRLRRSHFPRRRLELRRTRRSKRRENRVSLRNASLTRLNWGHGPGSRPPAPPTAAFSQGSSCSARRSAIRAGRLRKKTGAHRTALAVGMINSSSVRETGVWTFFYGSYINFERLSVTPLPPWPLARRRATTWTASQAPPKNTVFLPGTWHASRAFDRRAGRRTATRAVVRLDAQRPRNSRAVACAAIAFGSSIGAFPSLKPTVRNSHLLSRARWSRNVPFRTPGSLPPLKPI